MTDRQAAEARERERTAELVRAGAAFQQARWMARQERLDDAEGENERLWDQADEIAALKSEVDALSVRLAQAEQNAGMCPVCEEWAGRGHGCEWCSEFAHESGWNDARAEVVAQAEQERDEWKAAAREAAETSDQAFAAVNEARAEVASVRAEIAARAAASGGREAPDTKESPPIRLPDGEYMTYDEIAEEESP